MLFWVLLVVDEELECDELSVLLLSVVVCELSW